MPDTPTEPLAVNDDARSRWAMLRDTVTNPWFLVLVLVVIFAALSQLTKTPAKPIEETSRDLFPMVYMEGVNIREYGASGQLHHQMMSENIRQFQTDPQAPGAGDHFHMVLPVFTFYENQTTPWQASAKEARGLIGDKNIVLQDEVLIQQDSPEHGLMTLATTRLNIETSTQHAHTDQPVQLKNQRATLDAVGLDANLQENRIQLISNVRIHYAAP